jgi:lysozyme
MKQAKRSGVAGGAVIIIAVLAAAIGFAESGGPASAAQLPSSCPATASSALAAAAARDGGSPATMKPAVSAVTPLPGVARGIDISSNNPEPAWPAVKSSGISFVGIKATEGDYYANTATTSPVQQPGYATEAADATAAGLSVIPYVFANPYQGDGTTANPGNGSGTCQADYAWQEISSVTSPQYSSGLMLPVALDMEADPYTATEANSNECYGLSQPALVTWIGQFLAEIQKVSGKTPVIYTESDFWSMCTGNSGAFSSYPLWLADYGTASPPAMAGWSSPAFWQYTSAGTVPGLTGTVDLDYLTPVTQDATAGPR